MKILITGPSGSGKTHLLQYLQQQGLPAVGTDETEGMAGYCDTNGPVEMPDFAVDQAYLESHRYLWSPTKLKELLKQPGDLYMLGFAENAFEHVDDFDYVFFLHVPAEVIEDRLQHDTRQNPFGKTAEQRRLILAWHNYVHDDARKLGLIFLDGTQSPEALLSDIKTQLNRSKH